jgi:hypothetical protein
MLLLYIPIKKLQSTGIKISMQTTDIPRYEILQYGILKLADVHKVIGHTTYIRSWHYPEIILRIRWNKSLITYLLVLVGRVFAN